MPHVSSKKLKPEFLEKLFGKLLLTLGEAQNKKYLPSVVDEFFTSTEKIMLAKRLAIILMLEGKTPQHRVVEILSVSPSTVARISLEIEVGKYEALLKVSKKEKTDFEKVVWGVLTAGGIMPPKIGRKYWTKHNKK